MSALGETTVDKNIKCIRNNMEKYMTFCIEQLWFIGSFQFMNSSLDLADSLTKDDIKIMDTHEQVKDNTLPLLQHKGVYPYEYMDNFAQFKKQKASTQRCLLQYAFERAHFQ